MKNETILLVTGVVLSSIGIVYAKNALKDSKMNDSFLPIVTTVAGISLIALNIKVLTQ